jgi:putative heme transporter
MSPHPAAAQRRRVQHRDERLRRWGMRGWYLVGIFAAASVVFGLAAAISGLVIPLVVAIVVGVLFVPVVDRLARAVPRSLAAGIVLLGLSVAIAASLVVTVAGVVDQAPEIGRRLASGFDEIAAWLDDMDLDVGAGEELVSGFGELWSTVAPGLASYLGTVFSGTAAFLAGTFVAVFMLYFMLYDWQRVAGWVAAHLGVSEEIGSEIVADATWSLRQYFMALTVASILVAAIVGSTVAILGIPLAVAITVVTFFTSYIPYLGALFSGTFAVLIALGSGGVGDATIILVVVLVAQNVVQTVVQTKLSQDRLSLHPIVIFGSTIAGGATLGLLGAALSTPVTALLVRINTRLDASWCEGAGSDGASTGTEPVTDRDR